MPRKASKNAREEAALLLAEDRLTDAEIAAEVGITDRQLRNWKQDPTFRGRVEEHLQAYRERIRNKGIAVLERRVEAANRRAELLEQVRRERAADPSMQAIPGGGTGLLIRRGKLVKVFTPLQLASSSQKEDDPCPQCSEGVSDLDEAPRLRPVWVRSPRTGEETEQLLCPECGDRWRDTDQLSSVSYREIVYEYELDGRLLTEMREHEKQVAQELGQWKERKELTGKDGGPIETRGALDLSLLSDEELDALERLAAKADPDSGGDPE